MVPQRTFELIVLSRYEVKERAPYLGETRLTIMVSPPRSRSTSRQ